MGLNSQRWSAPNCLSYSLGCLDLHLGGLVLSLPLEVPRHAVHLATGPSEEHAGQLPVLLLGCHAEVVTSQQ